MTQRPPTDIETESDRQIDRQRETDREIDQSPVLISEVVVGMFDVVKTKAEM